MWLCVQSPKTYQNFVSVVAENVTAVYNETKTAETFHDHVIPIWRQIFWTALFLFISLVGTIGNFIVVWIVLVHKNMRTVTNLFLVNLAVADGLVAALNVPFVSYQSIYSDWRFGLLLCKIDEGIATISICVSVLTLSMISIDRYTAIMYPFKRRMGRQKTFIIMALIWFFSFMVTSPTWYFAQTGQYHSRSGQSKSWCGQIWPRRDLVQLYIQAFMIMTYFVPLICMTFTYSRIGLKLWGSGPIGELTKIQIKKELAKKKIVKMMIFVVLTFAICWLPFHSFFILTTSGLVTKWPVYREEIYLSVFWLAMSNSMYNPIIYCWMNDRFRAGFKKAFKYCPFITYEQILDDTYFTTIISRKSVTEIEILRKVEFIKRLKLLRQTKNITLVAYYFAIFGAILNN